MTRKSFLTASIVLVVMLSGCFVDYREGGTVGFDGRFNVSNGEFSMQGTLEFKGVNPPQDSYDDIVLKLYARNGTLLHEQHVGTIQNQSDTLDISVSLSTVPHYVIFDSPDLWDGETEVEFYTRSTDAEEGYRFGDAIDRSELPITTSD